MIDRKDFYIKLWTHTDRYGILRLKQGEFSRLVGLPQKRVSLIMSEFIQAGHIRKKGWTFQLRDPARIDWDLFLGRGSPTT